MSDKIDIYKLFPFASDKEVMGVCEHLNNPPSGVVNGYKALRSVFTDAMIDHLETADVLLREVKEDDLKNPAYSYKTVGGACDQVELTYMFDEEAEEREIFYVFYLDCNCRLIKKVREFTGSLVMSLVSPQVICRHALELKASRVILAHNHPSGDLTPSKADIKVTKQVKSALALIEVTLCEHIIYGNRDTLSFVDEGLL